MSRFRDFAKRGLEWCGVFTPVQWCLREVLDVVRFEGASTLVQNARYWYSKPSDGLPVPPSRLFRLVSGNQSVEWFLDGGSRSATSIRKALDRSGVVLEHFERMLDFGCGCGRVGRYWHALEKPKYCGTDYNPLLIEWCRSNLPFGSFSTNLLEPPLAYGNEEFDFVYAMSVFTHLPEALQLNWMAELHRILRPGGYLLITTMGLKYGQELAEPLRSRFMAGQLVVRGEDVAGTNPCAAYHPKDYVLGTLSRGFELVDFIPEGAKGTGDTDISLLRKPVTHR